MKTSTMFRLLAALQVLLAVSAWRDYARWGAGVDLVFTLVCSAVAVLLVVRGQQVPRDERLPRADPRFLRIVAFTCLPVAVVCLAVIAYRVLALERSPWDPMNLILTAACIFPLGYGTLAAAGLVRRRRDGSGS
jgi:hypothetical protein